MRRIISASLVCVALAATATAALGTATAGAKGQSSFKVGTYKGSVGSQKISFTVKRASCGGKTQLCVTLSKSDIEHLLQGDGLRRRRSVPATHDGRAAAAERQSQRALAAG
jgi:hypothetical protein